MPTKFFRSTAAAAAVGVGSLGFLAGPADAQICYPPTADCVTTTSAVATTNLTFSLSATTVVRGQTVGLVINGLLGGSTGIITIASVEQQIGSFTMPASGPASASVTIPTNISLGAHTIFVRGTGLNGQPASASQGVNVVAAGTILGNGGTSTGSSSGSQARAGGSLAKTGAIVVPTALVGVGLVLGGLALKRSSNRSKTSSTG